MCPHMSFMGQYRSTGLCPVCGRRYLNFIVFIDLTAAGPDGEEDFLVVIEFNHRIRVGTPGQISRGRGPRWIYNCSTTDLHVQTPPGGPPPLRFEVV